ncbi:MAG: PIG-L family deacetylase [Ktedonobacteraceae bacterium]
MQLSSLNDITTTSRHIFLSPHFEDVVYSCGGTLAVQVSNGLRPLVITVFAGIPPQELEASPLALQIHREMGAGNQDAATIVTNRRKEDANALDYLHVDYLWLNYLDAIYRGDPAYYSQQQQLIGGEVDPGDMSIDTQLAQALVSLSERLPDTVWYAPLGVGRHVDHQLVTSAADRLIQRGANVKYYEDFPYILVEGALEKRTQELGSALEPAYVEMSEMLATRMEAAAMYTSQTQLNFGNRAKMHKAMEDYTYSIRPVKTVHLERYWTVR